MNSDSDATRSDRLLLTLSAAFLVWCFVSGGDSSRVNPGMTIAQLLALPLLAFAMARCARRGRLSAARWGVIAAVLIVLVPGLQLLPLPETLWKLSADRVQLLRDLDVVGVAAVDARWTLSPQTTERAIHFLLPGLALFFCMLALGRTAWQKMLGLIIILCVGNVILAFAQMVAGRSSLLNWYPEFAPFMGGIFANRNHHADFLAIGLMVVVSLLVYAWKTRGQDRRSGRKIAVLSVVAMTFAFTLPLVGSRAGVIVAMVMLLAVLLTSGLTLLRSVRRSRSLQAGAVVALLVFATGLYAAFAWMKFDVGIEGSRHTLLNETLRVGTEQAPWGSGIGTFKQTFQRRAGDEFLVREYVNNAHNEYAQWWLEGGVLAVLVVVLVLLVLAACLVSLMRLHPESKTRLCGIAALMGVGVVVLHSTVDYPLRTQALMAVFSALCGIAVAAASSKSTARL